MERILAADAGPVDGRPDSCPLANMHTCPLPDTFRRNGVRPREKGGGTEVAIEGGIVNRIS